MDTKEKKVDLPEVLEFLKLARTVNRQLQLFSEVEISDENMKVIEKAVKKMRNEMEKFNEAIKKGV